ncbi:hypothetical protein [Olleya sp. Bg11-27]|uniref:hypothetical protein n=1 Tax=Olleya sp. Bg11-27 TaxID=2058135 RepID=UPI000C303498|nr:hypothetical protein [Olleya sp. Bg11-27]AUC75943.1 hypothetical protein CW732_09820 [Olleya sp. Bg11-27]
MKKTTQNLFTVLLLVALFFTSCKSEQESMSENSYKTRDMIVKAKLSKNIKAKLQYPDSYEFVELKVKDSVLYSENISSRLNYYQQIIEADRKNLEKQELYKKEGSSLYKEDKVNELQATVSKNEKILVEIDRIATELGEKVNETAYCTYNYRFKSKNTSGKSGDYNYIVQTGQAPEYKVLMIAEKESMITPNPIDFPGYNEMIKSFE